MSNQSSTSARPDLDHVFSLIQTAFIKDTIGAYNDAISALKAILPLFPDSKSSALLTAELSKLETRISILHSKATPSHSPSKSLFQRLFSSKLHPSPPASSSQQPSPLPPTKSTASAVARVAVGGAGSVPTAARRSTLPSTNPPRSLSPPCAPYAPSSAFHPKQESAVNRSQEDMKRWVLASVSSGLKEREKSARGFLALALSVDEQLVTSLRAPSPLSPSQLAHDAAKVIDAYLKAGGLYLEVVHDLEHAHQFPERGALLKAASCRLASLLDRVNQLKAGKYTSVALKSCTVCYDPLPVSDGLECSAAGHFCCSTCFDGHVKSKIDPESMRVFGASKGAICCPAQCDSAPFAPAAIVKNVLPATFESLCAARAQLAEQRISSTLEQDFELRLKLKEAEWQKLSEGERRRRANRSHVVERILTLACPRCGQAFVDFEGCFALTCSRDNAAFCAYCLTDCGADAHRHVAGCEHNLDPARSVFASKQVFETAQLQRRARMLRAHLDQMVPEERKALLEDCATDFQDLHIDVATL